jgi:cob(I)alamin adenosyltransferase
MSIVTKTGDQGETSLMYGRRVPKNHPRIEACGCIDELTAALGLARSICDDKFIAEQILGMQKDLINLMGELVTLPEDRQRYAKDGFHATSPEMVDRLTATIIDFEKDESLYPKDWVLPGAGPLSAALDFARTTCRRAECRVTALAAEDKRFNPEILRYLNRLSDLCWILARVAERNSRSEIRKPRSEIR